MALTYLYDAAFDGGSSIDANILMNSWTCLNLGKGKGDCQIDYVPAPRITEADKMNDRKLLQRALDRRLYLLLYGNSNTAPSGKPVWHFPEKVYDSEETLHKLMVFTRLASYSFLFYQYDINMKYLQCAESALESVLGDLFHTYLIGNAPMEHMVIQQMENVPEPFKVFQAKWLYYLLILM
ncbi:hypothetical protein PVK06_010296 [Gossypium arboreum]|uniref:Uncharacterized protein n=1 Tax=Gossypium arboreum TaxID=29729 RepID=A0ABR0Q654_GOSAR|nr:hypothetical protein PVK06_010296 [Gossypium arboreum]